VASTTASSPGSHTAPQQAVLLVDDEGDIVESLKELIERSLPTVRVYPASSGPEALELLQERRYDLYITDYKMPGMNGLEFLRRAEQVAPGVPRILITAFPDLQIAIQAINEAEIDKFFTKPFDGQEVIDAVRHILVDKKGKEAWSRSFMDSLAMLKKRSSLDE
jgi:two-component system, probable response regulator PhcQ